MAKLFKRTQQVVAGVALPVLAAHHADGITKKTVLALHECKSCDTRMVLNKLAAPSCLVCGSTTTQAPDAPQGDVVITPENMKELAPVGHCDTCNTDLRATKELASVLKNNKGYCPVCSEVVAFSFDDEESEDEEEYSDDEEEYDDSGEEDDSVFDPTADESDSGTESEEYSDDEEYDDEEDEEEEAPVLSNVKKRKKKLAAKHKVKADDEGEENTEEGEDNTSAEETPQPEPVPVPEVKPEVKPEPEVKQEETAVQSKFKTSALAAFIAKPYDAHLELVKAGVAADPKWYMFLNDAPVAVAHISRASEGVRKVFASDNFVTTFETAVEDDGLTEKVVKDFGFEPTVTEVPVDEAVELKVQEEVAAKAREWDEKLKAESSLFERCIGIAAVGMNKGAFADVKNPVRTAMISSLQKNRVRGAEALVDRVFAEHGEEMLRDLIGKALELTKKPTEGLNEIASFVAQANYAHSVQASVEPESQPGMVPFMSMDAQPEPAPAPREKTTASLGDSNVQALFASLGQKRFR